MRFIFNYIYSLIIKAKSIYANKNSIYATFSVEENVYSWDNIYAVKLISDGNNRIIFVTNDGTESIILNYYADKESCLKDFKTYKTAFNNYKFYKMIK